MYSEHFHLLSLINNKSIDNLTEKFEIVAIDRSVFITTSNIPELVTPLESRIVSVFHGDIDLIFGEEEKYNFDIAVSDGDVKIKCLKKKK